MAGRLKQTIREQLVKLIKYREFQLANGYGKSTTLRMLAITEIRKTLSMFEQKDDKAHARMFVGLKKHINALLYTGKKKREIFQLMDYCEHLTKN